MNKTNDYAGIRCSENPLFQKSSNKKAFSIKIESTQDVWIMFGFCANPENDTSGEKGYWNTKFSFMLNLFDGRFYIRSKYNYMKDIKEDLKKPARNNEIFSASLDINRKTIKFYLNGRLLKAMENIDLTTEEAEIICPCVDMFDKKDKVSLVLQEIK